MSGGKYKIGIDLGGTKTEAILLDQKDAVLHRKRIKTPVSSGYESIVRCIYELIVHMADKIPVNREYTIGIGIPGSINIDTQLVQNANTTCLNGMPIQRDLESLVKRKTEIQNDANCFTLAESLAGSGSGYSFVFGIIMGTGCGGGICIDGKIRKGPHSIAGEWGHFSVDPQGVDCYCGNRGCIETKISGGGVESAYLKKYGKHMAMTEIAEMYRNGEESCASTFNDFIDDFGRCLGGLISIIDPDAVVIGGGLSNIPELYTEGYKSIVRYSFHNRICTPVLKNNLGDSAGVFGAAWIGI